jgi:hypothetical protein
LSFAILQVDRNQLLDPDKDCKHLLGLGRAHESAIKILDGVNDALRPRRQPRRRALRLA